MTVVVPRSRLSGPWTISVHVIWPNLRFWLIKIPFCRVDDLDKHDMQHWNQISRVLHLLSVSLSKNCLDFCSNVENISVIIRHAWKGQIVLGDSILSRSIGNPLYYTLLESWSVWKFESKCLNKKLTSGKTLHYIIHHLGVCEAFRV